MTSLRTTLAAAVLGLVAIAGTGCPTPVTPAAPLPSITSFTATPDSVKPGDTVTLAWQTKNATAVKLHDELGNTIDVSGQKPGSGSVDVTVTDAGTTTYILLALNADGKTASKNVTVTVNAVPAVVSFTATPDTVPAGSAVTLAWQTTDADTVAIVDDQGNTVDVTGASPTNGSVTVNPTVTATYTLTATGAGGTATADASVTVLPLPAIVSFTSDNTAPVLPGSNVALTWQTTDTNSLTITDDQGATVVDTTAGTLCDSGSACLVAGDTITVTPAAQSVYTLTATGDGGTTTATVTVDVLGVVSTFTVTPSTVRAGDTVTLDWTTGGGTSATITGPDAFSYTVPAADLLAGSTTATVNTAGDFTFTLTAPGNTDSATATVALTTGPLVRSFSAAPADVTVGNDVTLTWVVAGATSLSLDMNGTAIDVSANNPDGDTITQTMSTAGAYTFTLTATNANGTDTATANVNVVDLASVDTFVALPTRVPSGGSTTLTWTTTGATSIRLEKDGADVGATATDVNGTFTDTVAADATYVLYALNAVGTETASAPITVTVGAPVNTGFTASATTAAPGDTVNLAWTNDGGTTVAVADASGPIAACGSTDPAVVASGNCDVTVSATPGSYDYTLTVSDASGGTATATVTITVSDGPIIRSFTGSFAQITVGDSVDLTWAVDNAYGVATPPTLALVDDQGNTYDVSANNANADTFTVTPTATGTFVFTLTASDASTTSTDTATVTVEILAAPQITAFAANPPSLDTQGGTVSPSSDLTWTTTGATVLRLYALDATGTPVSPPIYVATAQADIDGGTYTVVPAATTTYRLHIENAAGAVAGQDVTVIVDGAVVDSFTATDPIGTVSSTSVDIIAGESATLDWATTRADSVSLSPLAPNVTEGTGGFIDVSTSTTATQVLATVGNTSSATEQITFPAGFTFPFFGQARTSALVATSGWMSFDTSLTGTYITNYAIPRTGNPRALIAPFWDWQYTQGTGTVWYDTGTDASGTYLVIQWKNFQFGSSTSNPSDLNYEVVLHDNGNIDFHYGLMDFTASTTYPNRGDGGSATIGFDDDAGINGYQYSYNTPVAGGLANKDIYLDLTVPTSGTTTVSPTTDTTYTLTASNPQGTDTKQVTVVVHPAVAINTTGSTPAQPEVGSPFDITWSASNATQVVVTDSVGNVLCTVTDPATVNNGTCSTTETTPAVYDYTITATGALPRDVATATDSIQVYPVLSIDSFTVNGTTADVFVAGGSTVNIAWATTGALGFRLLAATTDITPASPTATGATTDTPAATLVYTFYISDTADFSGRTRTASVTVYVDAASVDTVGVTATQIPAGGTSDLSWTTTNATTVTVEPSIATTTGNTFTSIAGGAGTQELVPTSYDSATVDFTTQPNGFFFPFDGTSVGDFRVSTNGWVEMGQTATSYYTTNYNMPSTSSPNGILAPFWDDLTGSSTQTPHIYWQLSGVPGSRVLTIEWNNFEKWNYSGVMTFQALLYENGDVEYRYLTMAPDVATNQAYYEGSSATVGWENLTGTVGNAIVYNTASPALVGPGISDFFYLGSAGASGTRTVSPSQTTTYQVCATGGGYTDCKSVTVIVIEPGNIMINEIMANPAVVADSAGEWFELANTTANDIDINGWTVSDLGTDSFVIANGGPLMVPAHGFVVLGNNGDTATNGGVTEDYNYGTGMFLSNSADEILIGFSGVTIDEVDWDATWPVTAGASMSLANGLANGDPTANDVAGVWCAATTAMTGGDLGTPGAASDVLCGQPLTISHTVGVAIPDGQGSATTCGHPGAVSDTIAVPAALGGLSIVDVNVGIDITHTWDSDLDIFLEYTDGTGASTCVELSTDNGSLYDNYTGTIFDDQATTSITAGSAPFTGSYIPEGSLGTLNGQLYDGGTFTIWVSDDLGGDTGTLNSWSITAAY